VAKSSETLHRDKRGVFFLFFFCVDLFSGEAGQGCLNKEVQIKMCSIHGWTCQEIMW